MSMWCPVLFSLGDKKSFPENMFYTDGKSKIFNTGGFKGKAYQEQGIYDNSKASLCKL